MALKRLYPVSLISKDELKTGHILGVHGNGGLSKAIEYETSSYWSHIAIIIRFKSHLFVIESDFRRKGKGFLNFLFGAGIVMTPFDDYFKNKSYDYVIVEDPFILQFEDDIIDFAFPMCGHFGYDYFGLIRQLYHYTLKRWLNKNEWLPDAHPERRFTCSKFQQYVFFLTYRKNISKYLAAGMRENPYKDWREAAPVNSVNMPGTKKYSLIR
jgi:hypothetical protein